MRRGLGLLLLWCVVARAPSRLSSASTGRKAKSSKGLEEVPPDVYEAMPPSGPAPPPGKGGKRLARGGSGLREALPRTNRTRASRLHHSR